MSRVISPERRTAERRSIERRLCRPGEPCRQSAAELIGYTVHAGHGLIGRVEDFCLEAESLMVTGIVIRTRGLLWRKRILVPLDAIGRIDWRNSVVFLRLTRDELARLPGTTRRFRN